MDIASSKLNILFKIKYETIECNDIERPRLDFHIKNTDAKVKKHKLHQHIQIFNRIRQQFKLRMVPSIKVLTQTIMHFVCNF